MSQSHFVGELPDLILGFACNVALTDSAFSGDLPLIEGDFESGYSRSTFSGELPVIEGSFESLYSHSSFAIELSQIEGAFGCKLTFSSFSGNLPIIEGEFTGRSHSFSSFSGDLPMLEAIFTAANYTFSSFSGNLPGLIINFVSDGSVVYKCLVLHNEVAFTDWEFNDTMDSIAEFDGDIYIASSAGLFTLGGADDNGIPIDATIQIGLSDEGVPNFKQALGYYLSLRSDGKMQLQMIADDEEDGITHDIRTTGDKIKTRWGMTEKGPRGRFLGAKIVNVSGCDFRIKSLDIPIKVLYTKRTNA